MLGTVRDAVLVFAFIQAESMDFGSFGMPDIYIFFLVPNSLCKLHTDVHVKTKIKVVKME